MRILVAGVVLALAALTGCHSGSTADQQASANPQFKIYKLRGKVMSTNPATGEVSISNEDIPGFMEPMIMPYKLKNPGIISDIHPGDVLTADLFISQSGGPNDYIDHIVIVAQGKPDYKPAVIYHVPAPGDAVPNFKLRNEDGREIHLDQFRGKTLLLTFIYTRCPLPNFCPLVTHNFAVINSQLAANPAIYAKTHLLCISFDPVHDTPARLRAYGAEYIGSDAKSAFAHWDFAVPTKPELELMARYFDVGYSAGPNDTITHTLSTTLIGPRGKVAQFYPGNEWTPQQVLADVKQVAAKAG
jgi:protein SCO1/2